MRAICGEVTKNIFYGGILINSPLKSNENSPNIPKCGFLVFMDLYLYLRPIWGLIGTNTQNLGQMTKILFMGVFW